MRHETHRPCGGALRDRGGSKRASCGENAGAGYRLQECSSGHEVHIPVAASDRAASMAGARVSPVALRRIGAAQATLPTPQKNGSGPLTTPLTFLRQA